METRTKTTVFELGQIVATPGALESIPAEDIADALGRHQRGDWGGVCEDDRKENEFSLGKHLRLFSVYHAEEGTKFWIITEADRSATTILLPEEY